MLLTATPETANYVLSESSTITLSLTIIGSALALILSIFWAFIIFDRKFNSNSAKIEQLQKDHSLYVSEQDNYCDTTCGKNDKEIERVKLEYDKKLEILEKSIQKDIKRTEEVYESHFKQYYEQNIETKKAIEKLSDAVLDMKLAFAKMPRSVKSRKKE